jgi:hypothetical protein
MERLTNEEEVLIFETELKLFSIGIIIILKEIVSLLNIRMLEIKINEESEPQQGTLYQGAIEVVPSTTKTI